MAKLENADNFSYITKNNLDEVTPIT